MDIRLAATSDAAEMVEIYQPIVASTPVSFEVDPPEEEEMRRRIEATLPKLPWLVCEYQGQVIAYAYAGAHRSRAAYRWSVDASVYVHPAFHRCGVGTGLYISLFRILTAQGYFNAYAGITLPNAGSVGLHESLGFHPVGIYRNVGYKLGRWHDVGWWQKPLRQLPEVPGLLSNLDELQNDPSWQPMLIAGLLSMRTRGSSA